ncbi:MAG: Holliday junction resolvase RuvX [Steroidobacteraceae bacterium]|jgi:putative Holliday junction resolvase
MPDPAAPEPAVPNLDAPGPGAPAPVSSAAAQVILAFDFGRRRIGVACGDTVSRSAAPLGAVPVRPAGLPWDALGSLMREWRPAVLVVGLPYNVDGTESGQAGAARGFADELARRYALPVRLVDERYSSLEAGTRLKDARESGARKRRVSKPDVDAAAACIILERWFNEKT